MRRVKGLELGSFEVEDEKKKALITVSGSAYVIDGFFGGRK